MVYVTGALPAHLLQRKLVSDRVTEGKTAGLSLADIKSVSLTSERFERRGHIHSLVAEERFISALPHFSFIHKLINTFNL